MRKKKMKRRLLVGSGPQDVVAANKMKVGALNAPYAEGQTTWR